MNEPLLSILICHIPSRTEKLKRLMKILNPQIPSDMFVEVIIQEESPQANGGPTIGANRNELILKAHGKYVCFVDDDDTVVDSYVKDILTAIKSPFGTGRKMDSGQFIEGKEPIINLDDGPDVIGMKGHYHAGGKTQVFIHSLKYDKWFTEKDVFYRPPNHLNPIRRTIALRVSFPYVNHGEDHEYSMAARELLRTEVMIDKVIYHYHK